MFDIGFWELFLIGLIGLLVLGPQRLPEAARMAGRWLGRARRFIANVKQDLDKELHSEDLAEFRKLREELDRTRQILQESSSGLLQRLNEEIPVGTEMGDTTAEATKPVKAEDQRSRTKEAKKTKRPQPAKKPIPAKKPGKTVKKSKSDDKRKAPKGVKRSNRPVAKKKHGERKAR